LRLELAKRGNLLNRSDNDPCTMTQTPVFKGLVIDLDGVLFIDDRAVTGAADALLHVKAAGLHCRFVTNTSTLTVAALHSKLQTLGLPIERHEIISAPEAAHRFLLRQSPGNCYLLLAKELCEEFGDLRQVALEHADFIVLGDIGDALSRPLLDAIFNRLMQGAQLIAVHKNRFWHTGGRLRMDIGGFVAALEYCTGRPALVMGKPSADFFRVALGDIGADAHEVVMVGDDIDSDIGGAQRVGLVGILTRTGKFRQQYVEASSIRPDLVIDSIEALPDALVALQTSARE